MTRLSEIFKDLKVLKAIKAILKKIKKEPWPGGEIFVTLRPEISALLRKRFSPRVMGNLLPRAGWPSHEGPAIVGCGLLTRDNLFLVTLSKHQQ